MGAYLILAAAAVALLLGAEEGSYAALIPGLVLYGTGLGIVLTVNDPTGLNSVPDDSQGEAAGMINTSEQLGGVLGIVALSAVTFTYYREKVTDLLASQGIQLSERQADDFRDFIAHAQRTGLRKAESPARRNRSSPMRGSRSRTPSRSCSPSSPAWHSSGHS